MLNVELANYKINELKNGSTSQNQGFVNPYGLKIGLDLFLIFSALFNLNDYLQTKLTSQ
jgi:hypothetical protein